MGALAGTPTRSGGRLLVTGARGFVGRHVIPLAKLVFDVHAVSRTDGHQEPDVTWHRVDLMDPAARRSVLRRVMPTHLLHLAWYTEHGLYWNSPANLQWTAASLDLLHDFHRAGGARFVGVGTCAEYKSGSAAAVEGITRERPTTVYGECKLAVGRVALAFAAHYPVQVAWARLFYLFGPGEPPERFVPSLITDLARHGLAVCRHANYARDYLYVRDVASALVALVGSATEGPVNVASGTASPLGDLARLVFERVGGRGELQLETPPIGPGETPVIAADVTRLTQEVGWRPAVPLVAGIDETVAWWTERFRMP